MKQNHKVFQMLVSSRNLLLSNIINEDVVSGLNSIISNPESITLVSTRNIVCFAIEEALKYIEDSNYYNAGIIINFIHNLPLDWEMKKNWNDDYFLSIELTEFLERLNDISSVKKIVFLTFKEFILSGELLDD